MLAALLLYGGYKLFMRLNDDHKEFVATVMDENGKREKRLLDNQAVFGEKMGEIVTCFKSLEVKVDGMEADMKEVKADIQEIKSAS